ncbi:hypothetical protein EMIHUDRAFT_253735, partial [Emiliania huxleyi CCMP1516]|uniref:Endonuclease/exonuclease/phosphatase domain-containing protein n=2 Tax=Emiliania huxleyi TaxID=2903 RepID=A0A0D3K3H4_EMIH1
MAVPLFRDHFVRAIEGSAGSPNHVMEFAKLAPPFFVRRSVVFARVQRWKIPTHVIYSQNARGLKTDSALTEAIDALRHRSGFSAGLQETWRTGLEEIEEDGFVFLGAAPAVQNGRGSKGVGILLSPLAVAAWRAAGAVVHNDVGPRVIAVRMEVEDSAGRKQGLFQVASYAPISTAPDTEKDEYETALACVLSRRQSGDIVIVCADTNASIGRGCLGGQNVNYGAVGSHGIDFLNDSGRRLRSFMELHDLAALSSFFKKPFYGTWLHPCSKLQKQLDHIMISRCDLKRFTDAGACCGQLIDSDHSAVFCKLRFTVRLRRKLEPRAQLARLDTAPLLNQDQAVQFATDVVTSLGTSDASAVSYSTLAKAVEKTAAETLPKRERPAPLWFAAKEGVLRAVIANRNATFNAHQRQPTADAAAQYREARSRVQLEIRRAKSDWILGKCTAINDGICGATGSAAAWATVKVLKAGLAPPRRAPPAKMKKADGSLADTPEENASVFADAFSQLYGREASFDPSVLDDLPQRPVAVGLDHVPSDDEIQLATSKLHATAPGPSGLHARLWQALVSTSDGFGFNDFVLTGRRPSTVGDVEFSLRDSMYADDAGLAFCSRRGVEVETPKVVAHFARWGMEIHVGKDGSNGEPRKDSKSEVLFCAAAPTSYNNPATYDGADLSDIKLPGGCFMP